MPEVRASDNFAKKNNSLCPCFTNLINNMRVFRVLLSVFSVGIQVFDEN